MDQRLYVAACSGDVQALQKLLGEDPLVLFTANLANSDTPLHIAALLGHNEFAKLAMTQNPQLSKEFNRHGYSPIHLASLNGYLQIVKDLLNIDKGLCLLKDCEGRTALHCAAIKGRLDVIRHLVSCCPASAKEVTFKGETMLHLAVKNSQGQIMAPLISVLDELNLLDDLINCVDEDGNTVLHLATSRKQTHITKILLRKTNVNVNAINADGHNASTISETNASTESNSANINIGEMISLAQSQQRASKNEVAINGRNKDKEIVVVDSHVGDSPEQGNTDTMSPEADTKPTCEPTDKQYSSDSIKNGVVVVCSLFATFCLEAILNLPGDIKWEQLQPSQNGLQGPKNETIPANQLDKFQSFLSSDVMCFLASVVAIFMVAFTPSNYSYGFGLNSMMIGAVTTSAAILFKNVLYLATSDHLASYAITTGLAQFLTTLGILIFTRCLFAKKIWKVLRKACCKIRS